MRFARFSRIATIVALAALAAPIAGAAPGLTLDSANVSASWKESWLTGSIQFSGTVAGPAQLEAVLREVAHPSPPAAALDFSATAGPYAKTLKLPARLTPGAYRLTVDGTSGGAKLATAERDVTIPAPPEGVVDRSWASRKRGGPAVFTVPTGTRELWANVHFIAPATSGKLHVGWHSPSFRWYGVADKPYKQNFATGVHAGAALERGVWFCYIRSSGRVVKRVRVRVA